MRCASPGGSIVNIGSVVGSTTAGMPQAAYASSKAAIIGLTRDLAQQWTGRKGIRVNALAPGFFASEMTDQYPDGYLDSIIWRVPAGRTGRPASSSRRRSSSQATRRPTSPASCCRSTAACSPAEVAAGCSARSPAVAAAESRPFGSSQSSWRPSAVRSRKSYEPPSHSAPRANVEYVWKTRRRRAGSSSCPGCSTSRSAEPVRGRAPRARPSCGSCTRPARPTRRS